VNGECAHAVISLHIALLHLVKSRIYGAVNKTEAYLVTHGGAVEPYPIVAELFAAKITGYRRLANIFDTVSTKRLRVRTNLV
jgi:hypothetical protein